MSASPTPLWVPEDKESALFITGSQGARADLHTYEVQLSEVREGSVTPPQTLTGPGRPEEMPHPPHLFLD